jgi:hypothetical protein
VRLEPQFRSRWAGSRGERKKLSKLLYWFQISKGLAGTIIQAALKAGEIPGAVLEEISALGMYWRKRPMVFSLEPLCQGL